MTPEERRRALGQLTQLKNEIAAGERKLAAMEAHEGEDGIPEDVVGQCDLVEEINYKRIAYREIHSKVYPR